MVSDHQRDSIGLEQVTIFIFQSLYSFLAHEIKFFLKVCVYEYMDR